MQLEPIRVHNLTLLEAGQFVNSQLTGIAALGGPEFFTDVILSDYLEALGERQAALNNGLMVMRKSDETIKIEEQDNKQEQALSFLQKLTAAYEISDLAEERDAARSLKNLYSTYKKLSRLNYQAESLGIDNLLDDLDRSEYRSKIELLGLSRCITRLMESNYAFKMLYAGRTEDVVNQETFDSKSLRNDMLAVYNNLAKYVLAMANVNNSPDLYTRTLKVLNVNRKSFSDLLARRKGVAAEAM